LVYLLAKRNGIDPTETGGGGRKTCLIGKNTGGLTKRAKMLDNRTREDNKGELNEYSLCQKIGNYRLKLDEGSERAEQSVQKQFDGKER